MQYNVPVQLLQKINGIENPDVLLPGSELKVLRGPFEAEVDLQAQQLTVFLDRALCRTVSHHRGQGSPADCRRVPGP